MRNQKRESRRTALLLAGTLLASGIFAGEAAAGVTGVPERAGADRETVLPTYADPEETPAEEELPFAKELLPNEEETQAELPTLPMESEEPARGEETGIREETFSAVYGLPDASGIVDQCMPSLVSITNTIEVTTTMGFGFDWFFSGSSELVTQVVPAYGSGVIIGENEEELLIVTNNHVAVVDSAGDSSYYQYSSSKGLKVGFADGTECDANLKGSDSQADLAVIAVKLSDLPGETKTSIRIAEPGDSDEMKVGQFVIAIGNALGLGQTATFGYVSALNRDVTTEDGVARKLMQVDAAINEGNSGGGLFNSRGELVGINCAKYSDVGVEGIGYAIPISSVREIIEDLKIQQTKIPLASDERGYLGIVGEDVSGVRVSSYGYPAGAQIIRITEGSPAEKSGMQLGDIITAVNSDTVTTYAELKTALSYYAPGDTVTVTLQRIVGSHFEEQSVLVTLSGRDTVME